MSFSVAIVGPDGSGKTTVARKVLALFPAPIKYLYMGTAIQSANVALPTSRLLLRLKRHAYDKAVREGRHEPSSDSSPHNVEFEKVQRSSIARELALINLIAEEWYRQLVSRIYRWRGFVVLCDRHFVFEYLPDSRTFHAVRPRFSLRVHLWIMRHIYPRPDLTIFLDAPVEVLFERKGEWSHDHLRRHREGLLEQGARTRNFVVVDATRDLDEVTSDVLERLLSFRKTRASVESSWD